MKPLLRSKFLEVIKAGPLEQRETPMKIEKNLGLHKTRLCDQYHYSCIR